MTDSVRNLILAAEMALASKRGCPTMSRDTMHCNCWHCTLYRAIQECKKENHNDAER